MTASIRKPVAAGPGPGPADGAATPLPFTFGGQRGFTSGRGGVEPLTPGTDDSLGARVFAALAALPPGGGIGGALPFDRTRGDHLTAVERLTYERPPVTAAPGAPVTPARAAPGAAQLTPDPAPQDYAEAVRQALRVMADEGGHADPLRKVVLARTLQLDADRPIDLDRLLLRLGQDPATTAYRVALPDAGGRTGRVLTGATPELLVSKAGAAIASFPLAGSARRRADPVVDAAAASGLAASDKDRREHALVVEYILDTLQPLCRELGCPRGTGLTSTASMWHLGTRIEGRLRDPDMPSVLLASALHPTPAVCGVPRDRAARLIASLEPVDRGFYSGAVGWCDAAGDGEWYVAIRCAEVAGAWARLYAGAGIVPGSVPQAELGETGAKFAALLNALDITQPD